MYFFQVLLRCHAVLQEVPSLTRHRKSSSTSDSLSHMIATMTYYIAKVMKYILFFRENTTQAKISQAAKSMAEGGKDFDGLQIEKIKNSRVNLDQAPLIFISVKFEMPSVWNNKVVCCC